MQFRTASRIEAGKPCKDYCKYTNNEPKSQVQNNSRKNNSARTDHSQPKVAGGLFVAS